MIPELAIDVHLASIDAYEEETDALFAELNARLEPHSVSVWKAIRIGVPGKYVVIYRLQSGDGSFTQFNSVNRNADLQQLLRAELAFLKEIGSMNIMEAGVLKYLAGDMIKDKRIPCTIARVQMEEMPQGKKKPVLYLQGRKLGIVLNATNTRRLVAAYGYETDEWSGHPVTVYAEPGNWFGKDGWALRLAIPEQVPSSSNGRIPAGVLEMAEASMD